MSIAARDAISRQLMVRSRSRAGLVDVVVAATLLASLLTALAVLVVLLVDVVGKSLPVFTERGIGVLFAPLSPRPEAAGMVQGIFGSVMLTLMVVVLCFPLGVAAAIHLEEYARDTRFNRLIATNIRNLAGVPSIVYGLLGLTVFVKLLLEGAMGADNGRTLLAGGLTLAVLVLPIVVITAQEALRAVPRDLIEASMAVGATRWETTRYQALPVALPAILTGTVLALARAFGESAPLLLAGAVLSNFFSAPAGTTLRELVFTENYTALPIVIYNWSRQPQAEFVALTAAGIVVLLAILLAVNSGAIIARDRAERKR